MELITVEQRQEIVKASSERLRAKLIRAGYNEATVMAYDRQELMEAYAEYSLLVAVPPVEPQDVFADVGATAEQGGMEEEEVPTEPVAEERPDVAEAVEMTELDLRRREMWLRERELERQKEKDRLREKELERQKEKDEAERKERQEKEKADRVMREKDQKIREMELDLRRLELDRQREKDKEEKEERERQQKKDAEEKARR